LFNISNNDTVFAVVTTTGSSFDRPTFETAPRVPGAGREFSW
jgi:hypothetical protein